MADDSFLLILSTQSSVTQTFTATHTVHAHEYYRDSHTQLLLHTHNGNNCVVPFEKPLYVIGRTKPIWEISSLVQWGEIREPENISSNVKDKTSLIQIHARIIHPLSHKVLVCFGNVLPHTPDTSLSDTILIKMICSNSVINQTKQNDKWEIILWRRYQNSTPVEDVRFPNISFG